MGVGGVIGRKCFANTAAIHERPGTHISFTPSAIDSLVVWLVLCAFMRRGMLAPYLV
jgi:hypothetical protein